jgi:uncharacterized membrane protein YedE/YeeE
MHDFTPWRSLLGGALIGLSASLLLLGAGRVAGISGIFAQLFLGTEPAGRRWRTWFLGGLLAGGLVLQRLLPGAIAASPRPIAWLAASGLLVGIGTRLAGGCTSGHGVCGLSRLSLRSLVATLTFLGTGVLTVTLLRLCGPALWGALP